MLLHVCICEDGLEHSLDISTSLINAYSKCNSLQDAQKVFDRLSTCDAAAWGALVAGYASESNFTRVRFCLETMQKQGIRPNGVMFMSILAACSQGGCIQEGFQFFRSMVQDYEISPTHEHYSCILDLLARSGRLDNANDLRLTLEKLPDTVTWRSLLSSCRVYNNKNLATTCFSEVVDLDHNNDC